MTNKTSRPIAVQIYALLMLVSAAIMAALGWSANAYYVPAVCLLMQASLLWLGKGFGLFRAVTLLNQLSGLALILVLWLGQSLGDTKLDISASMLIVNLLCGGPLMALLAIVILPSLHRGKRLFQWFHNHAI